MPNFSLPDTVFEQAAQAYPTPFHLYDEGGIRRTARALNQAFAWCPDFKEYFAVKALPNPAILRILRQEGCGVDCSSATELTLAQACGFHGTEIMFSANAMPPEEFTQARALDAYINLDDITHIDVLRDHGGIPACVCCRYNPGGDFTIGNTIMGNPGDAKYGFTYAQLEEGLARLKELGVKSFGLHAFLSSNTIDNAYYPTLAELLFDAGRRLMDKVGLPLAFINLSGGVGIPYRPEQPAPDIAAIGEGVRLAYEKVFTANGVQGVAIKTELGRYMTGPHGWLVTHATSHKDTYKHYIGLDACAANLMRPAMYGAYHHITVVGKERRPLRSPLRRHRQPVRKQRQVCHRPDAAQDRHGRYCGHPRHRRPRLLHGLQLQRPPALRGGTATGRTAPSSSSAGQKPPGTILPPWILTPAPSSWDCNPRKSTPDANTSGVCFC